MQTLGRGTIRFNKPPRIEAYASVVGKKEGEGPLGECFDKIEPDEYVGESNWEKAESRLQNEAITLCLQKGSVSSQEVDAATGGDLLNQCVATSFAVRDMNIPFLGVFGACSTMAEGLIAASALLDGGYGSHIIASAGSHFCSAEKQFRTPLEYGSQRPPSAQWTVTGAGAVLLGFNGKIGVSAATIGAIVDKGITDANHMGSAMAPAFADTIENHFKNIAAGPQDYDAIFSGDLGVIGKELTRELLRQNGICLENNYHDCGEMMFDREKQDVHAGGSGCGCAASVLCSYVLPRLDSGEWKRVLFAATGALLSPTTVLQGESIPCIAHAVELVHMD
ncbi:MAG: stage V sporulation protein AD [Oscillospiraceae bacterium]|nr:stage V sporulation protein AD [Oscillospiraceae bacterium]